jgi:prephenate dehydratase
MGGGIDSHPKEASLERALEELRRFSRELRILGVFPANPFCTPLAK